MFASAVKFDSDISSWEVGALEDARFMFHKASAFNQSLCEWGEHLSADTVVTAAFGNTACPKTADPILTATPPGPFCAACN